MKVRWTNGSLRLRITPAELAALLAGDTTTEQLTIPGGGWTVSFAPTDTESHLNANGSIFMLRLSPADRDTLADPTTEGVYNEQDGMMFYVEKDFPCLHPKAAEAAERQTETFAAPPGFAERKAEMEN